jgi:hypothetical protein
VLLVVLLAVVTRRRLVGTVGIAALLLLIRTVGRRRPLSLLRPLCLLCQAAGRRRLNTRTLARGNCRIGLWAALLVPLPTWLWTPSPVVVLQRGIGTARADYTGT